MKTDGIQGLYRGFAISCVGIFIYRGMYFGMYDSLKPILLGEDAGVLLSFLLGWGVTITAGLMSYPIDTIRRRMMMTSGSAVKYKVRIVCVLYCSICGVIVLQFHGIFEKSKNSVKMINRCFAKRKIFLLILKY